MQTRKPNARHIGSRFRPSNPLVYGFTRRSFDLLDEIEQALALDPGLLAEKIAIMA